ncbi:hypothetical protein CRYUN_Cryun04dG0169500 [Craigia yunnanensis]
MNPLRNNYTMIVILRGRRQFICNEEVFLGCSICFSMLLRSLQGKHKLGELVCVSGKMRALSKVHYEMREYSIDVLKDENDSSVITKGRPYPIYVSKGGLNPNFLRDIIARFVPHYFVLNYYIGSFQERVNSSVLHDFIF